MIGSVRILPNDTGGDTFTTVSVGQWQYIPRSDISLQAWLSPAGGMATIEFHQTNNPSLPPSASTLMAIATLSGASDITPIQTKPNASASYKCVKCTSISGSAAVTAVIGV